MQQEKREIVNPFLQFKFVDFGNQQNIAPKPGELFQCIIYSDSSTYNTFIQFPSAASLIAADPMPR